MRYRFASFVLDTGQSRLFGPDGEITLRRQTLRALEVLLERAPAVVGRDELLDRAWGRQEISANAVSQAVLELRRALGDSAGEGTLIETRHRVGYRIVPEVQRIADTGEAPADDGAPQVAAARLPPESARGSRRLVLALAVFITALASVALWWSIPRSPSAASAEAVLRDQAPGDEQARREYWAGLLALRDGRLAEAIGQLDRAGKREPGSAAIQAALADALLRSGRFVEARAALAQVPAGALHLSRSDRLRWEALVALAQHDRREARSRYQAVFAYEPGDRETGYTLLDLHLEFADAKAAADAYQALEQIGGRRGDPRLALARARLAALEGDHVRREAAAGEAARDASPESVLSLLATMETCEARLARAALESAGRCSAELEQQAQAAGNSRVAARAAAIQGVAARESGRYAEAASTLQSASDAARNSGDLVAWRELELERAMLERARGELAAALSRLDALDQALAFTDDRPGQARLLGVRGTTLAQAGKPDQARAALGRSIELAVAMDLRTVEAGSRNNLALLDARSGRLAESTAGLERALALFRDLGDQRGRATALGNLAILAGQAGQPQRARELNLEALDAFRAIDAGADVARLQFNLGLAERRSGSLDQAAPRIEEALVAFRDLGAGGHQAQAAATLAQIELDRGRVAAAREILDAVPVEGIEDPLRRAALVAARSRAELLAGGTHRAREQADEARALREQAGSPAWVLASELDLARVSLAEGQAGEAESAFRRIGKACAALGEQADALLAELLVAEALLAQGQRKAAATQLERWAGAVAEAGELDLVLLHELLELAADGADASALAQFADRARASGRVLLALRAELLGAADAPAGRLARERLQASGLSIEVLAPGPRATLPGA